MTGVSEKIKKLETLCSRVGSLAQDQPEKEALVLKDEAVTYSELSLRVAAAASKLNAAGVRPGDRVLYSSVSTPDVAISLIAIQRVGAVAVAVDKNADASHARALYKMCGGSLFLTDRHVDEIADSCTVLSLRESCALDVNWQADESEFGSGPRNGEDIAEIIFTTGTTGVPKGVMLSYRAVQTIWENTVAGTGMHADDRVLLPLPMNHSVALRVLRAALSLGATVVFQNGFTFAKSLETNIIDKHCTALIAVPASIETVRLQMRDRFSEVLGQLRYIEVGAGSLTPSQRTLLAGQLPDTRVVNTWGSSETGGALFVDVSAALHGSEALLSATGKPVAGVEVKLEGMNSYGLPGAGKLALRGNMAMSGYWGRDDLTAGALRNGWIITNDLARMEDGYVFMLGRADDVINVGGEKVSPVEVENEACQYEGVLECACVGVPDPDGILGQVPVLFAVILPGRYDEADFRRFLSGALDRYKMPHSIIPVDDLPRNRMQKLNRAELREMWSAVAHSDASAHNLTNETVRSIMARCSVRRFTADKVDADELAVILKCGYHAPSGSNMQTWRFTVLEDAGRINRLRQVTEDASRSAGVRFYGFEQPPCVVLVSNDSRNATGCQDAACAAENMMVAASSLGLGSVWVNALMTLRDIEPAKTFLGEIGVPSTHIVWAMIAIGHPASDTSSPARRGDVVRYVDRA